MSRKNHRIGSILTKNEKRMLEKHFFSQQEPLCVGIFTYTNGKTSFTIVTAHAVCQKLSFSLAKPRFLGVFYSVFAFICVQKFRNITMPTPHQQASPVDF